MNYAESANISTANLINRLEIPRGGEFKIKLADGTEVWLNALAKPATIWNGRNLIDIDCGAAYEEIDVWGIVIKTRLACLRLDDMKEFYSEEDLNEEGNQRR